MKHQNNQEPNMNPTSPIDVSFINLLTRMIHEHVQNALRSMSVMPSPIQPRDPLFKSKDAARYLGIHHNTLHSYVKKGLIAVDVRAGNKHLFRQSTLDVFARK